MQMGRSRSSCRLTEKKICFFCMPTALSHTKVSEWEKVSEKCTPSKTAKVWVPSGPLLCFVCCLCFHDPKQAYVNASIESRLTCFTCTMGIAPIPEYLYRFSFFHLEGEPTGPGYMNQRPASKKKAPSKTAKRTMRQPKCEARKISIAILKETCPEQTGFAGGTATSQETPLHAHVQPTIILRKRLF